MSLKIFNLSPIATHLAMIFVGTALARFLHPEVGDVERVKKKPGIILTFAKNQIETTLNSKTPERVYIAHKNCSLTSQPIWALISKSHITLHFELKDADEVALVTNTSKDKQRLNIHPISTKLAPCHVEPQVIYSNP